MNIIINTTTRWDTEPHHARHYIANELKKNNHVLFIEQPTNIFEIFRGILKRDINTIFGNSVRNVDDDFYIYRPFTLFPPIFVNNIYIYINFLNQKFLSMQINRIIRKLRMDKRLILFNFDYLSYNLSKNIKNELCLYYCCDENNLTENPYVAEIEEKLAEDSDLIFCVSHALREKFKKFNNNTFLSYLGVDIRYKLVKNMLVVNRVNSELSEIKRPIIGYSGAISDRLDFNVLEYIVKYRRDWSFVFIGFVGNGFKDRFKKFVDSNDNVYYLGNKSHDEFMYYLDHFDVALVPFKYDLSLNKVLTANNKMFQYLLSGCPFVVTKFDGLIKLNKDFYYTAESADEYLASIAQALKNDSCLLRRERTNFAMDNSWEGRAEEILNKINIYLKNEYNQS